MRRVFLGMLVTAGLLAALELGIRALYGLARSSVFLAYHLEVERRGRLDLGPAGAAFLAEGFYPPTRPADGVYRVWSAAERAEVRWPILWRRDRRVRLRLRGFPHPSAEGMRLSVSLGGRHLAEVPLGRDWMELTLQVPASAQALGMNRLVLATSRLYPASLLPHGGADPRLLGFQLERMELL
jgi:hypothetical protein